MQRKRFLFVISCIVLVIFLVGCDSGPQPRGPGKSSHYYASPNGSGNSCTQKAPCSLEGVKSKVRSIAPAMNGDIVVHLLDGMYTLASPLTFTHADSGANGYTIVWQADGYGTATVAHPILSGGQVVTGWHEVSGHTGQWKAEVSNSLRTRQLYVNGVRAVRAASASGIPGMVNATQTGYTTTDTSLQTWHNPQEIEFVYSGPDATGGGFQEPRCDVASISGDKTSTTITMQQPCFDAGRSSAEGSANQFTYPTWIENAYELLTRPGQWYLDETGKVDGSGHAAIYYMPRVGEDMNKATVIAPTLETLVEGQGKVGAPVENLQFKGLTFAYATWLQPSGPNGFIQNQADSIVVGAHPLHYTYAPGNVAFHTAHNVRFERNVFTHLGIDGLVLDMGAQNNSVIGNVFTDISGTGIRLGDAHALQPRDEEQEKNNSIMDNYIHDVAVEYHGDDGFRHGYAIGTNFSHNEIAHVPYDGIEVGNQCASDQPSYSHDDHFSYNYVHDTMESGTLGGDGGSIYVDSIYPKTTVDHNFFDNNLNVGSTGALYTDCTARDFTINHNVVTHVGSRWLHNTMDNTVQYNYTDGSLEDDGAGTVDHNQIGLSSLPSEAQAIIDKAGIEPAYQDIKQGITTVDDRIQGTGINRFSYSGNGWKHCHSLLECKEPGGLLYSDSSSADHTANDSVSITFTGTQISLYGVLDPSAGIAAVAVDNGSETTVDLYAPMRQGNSLVWTSPTFAPGSHTLKVRVTGNKNVSSSDSFVAIDRVDIHA